ncbi:hypothetical protein HF313_14195 [Massilia atriviolacea]|uniref:Uncharacterized protein n=1 Tax=Massilia atriviolacea TaxID=2495579 RepID=A0A430HQT1_9BURK|nr:hypothetical protein [Massilia atriviolacea]RSZ59875.1 hypothetical protein EJB06_06730 [Massilia atriviolacea]
MRIATLLAGLMALACASPASALAQDKAAPKAGAKADGLGTVLPAGLTASALVALIAPGRDASLATLVGAKAWPHRANTFVAIACFARSKKELESEQKYSKGPSCEKFYQPGQVPEFVDPPVYLGVVQHQAGGAAPTLLASYGKPLDIKTNWDATSLDGPDRDVLTPGGAASGMMPASYRRFDFAPYRIAPADTAIGLRLGWHEGYAGGGAFYEALALFRIDGGKLVNILSEPVSFHSDLAGEWRKDGTREREVSEGTNVLSVLPSSTSGFADLQMRTLKGKWKQVFTWDGRAGRYLPVKAAPAAKSR